MANEKPIFVQCGECSTAFNVVFNGSDTVRCPNKDCETYLFFSAYDQMSYEDTGKPAGPLPPPWCEHGTDNKQPCEFCDEEEEAYAEEAERAVTLAPPSVIEPL